MTGSSRRLWTGICCALLALYAAPAFAQEATAPSGWRPRPVREGTVSLGGSLLYGSLFGGSAAAGETVHRFAEDFNHGVGVGFNLRYRTAGDAALAIAFEAHNFGVKTPSDSAAGLDHLQIITTTLDYVKYGATRTRMPKYWTIGAGLAQTRITDNDGEKEFPGDGGVFKVGAGLEYWSSRTLSVELGVRYYGVLLRSKLNHDVQAGIGFNFYTSP